jgi:SAM-dependent methyltransferase
MLSETLLCPACGFRLQFDSSGARRCCTQPGGSTLEDSIICYEPDFRSDKPEVKARDNEAHGYLAHSKFPIQIYRLECFVRRVSAERGSLPVLDLGCGPGPATQILLDAGFSVVGVDFSLQSLRLNAQRSNCRQDRVQFVQADLTRIKFAHACAGGLMMADFLQHLGDRATQRSLLDQALMALKPGGWFFLSFLNTNVKNRLKGDNEGFYSGGTIPYRRLTIHEVIGMLPQNVEVTEVLPMNIFHSVCPDRFVARLPLARLLARWMIIYGRRTV